VAGLRVPRPGPRRRTAGPDPERRRPRLSRRTPAERARDGRRCRRRRRPPGAGDAATGRLVGASGRLRRATRGAALRDRGSQRPLPPSTRRDDARPPRRGTRRGGGRRRCRRERRADGPATAPATRAAVATRRRHVPAGHLRGVSDRGPDHRGPRLRVASGPRTGRRRRGRPGPWQIQCGGTGRRQPRERRS
jgi:hypothetical protein